MKKVIAAGITFVLFMLLLNGCGQISAPGSSTIPPIATNQPGASGTQAAENTPQPTQDPQATPVDFSQMSPITGLPYDQVYKPVLVMIENQTSARPQDGLAEADVVYEAMVEGGITRFMAVYMSQLPEMAGPCRSCRVVFADIAKEWDGLLVHFGGPSTGSYSVYQRFIDNNIRQRIDGVKSNANEYTDPTRKAPHDKYMNIATVQKKYNYTPDVRAYTFTEDMAQGTQINTFTIDYNSYNIVRYEFNAGKNIYYRYQNGELVTNRLNGLKVEASNVIIQRCKQSVYADSTAGHIKIDVIGSGTATVYRNGVKIIATWKKKSASSATVYYDVNGSVIPLSPGKTWVQIVSEKTSVTEG